MKLTDRAVEYFKNELKEQDKKTVEIALLIACCSEGYKLHIGFSDNEPKEIVNGIGVYYNDEASDIVKNLIIDVKGEMILYE